MTVANMKCRKHWKALIASALMVLATAFPVCVGGGFGADLQVARMNVTTVGGGVPVAAASYGEGNLLSERWGAQGTWTAYSEGATISYTDTTYSGTGFVSSALKVSGSSDWGGAVYKSFGSDQSTVYLRFYYVLGSESWNDGEAENIFNLGSSSTEGIHSDSYLTIKLLQTSGQLNLRFYYNGQTESYDTGSNVYNISTGTIYKIEGKLIDDGSSDVVEWKVNGSVICRKSGALFSSVTMRKAFFGCSYNGYATAHYFDTIDFSSTGYLTDTP